ncbi:7tm Odorant receptor [Nesidiocoris tenuis]|uniref:Odorant receptor n=1 Tax=Nesidiocoris tenuis TaxID=355587 RepID=A0ABN7B1F9_9HEMI|nr:7tm Odorant receptor [Nesidiocoris tenuis]
MLHQEIEKYIQLMKYNLWWYGDFDYLTGSFLKGCLKFYLRIRWFLVLLSFIATCIGLSTRKSMGLYDGMFAYGPFSFSMFMQIAMITYIGEQQGILTTSLNNHFLRHNEPWMNTLREKQTAPMRKTIMFLVRYNLSIIALYMFVPLVLDTVLHYGFNSIEEPIVLPLPFNSFFDDGPKWNLKFYVFLSLNWWFAVEMCAVLQGPVAHYAILSGYFQTEIQIFTERIKMLKLDEGSKEEIDEQISAIVQSHSNLMVLNQNLKSVFGLPCAFSSLFISVSITLCLFTVLKSDNMAVIVAYGSGIFLNGSTGILYCALGQKLEDESEEMFRVLCDLPWFECKPEVRKSLNMMIRQAKTPLNIDYHGRSKMNLSTFMQILRSSYSYFTLLQSMTN